MNAAYMHLVLNHLPVIATLIGVLLLAWAAMSKNGGIARAALAVLLLGSLGSIPTYLTGEPAEEVVEHLPGVSHDAIEEHEEAAGTAFIGQILLGLLSLAGLVIVVRRGDPPPGWIIPTTLVVGLICLGLIVWTANLGGRIRHTEIAGTFRGSIVARG